MRLFERAEKEGSLRIGEKSVGITFSKRTETPGRTTTFWVDGLTISYGADPEPDEQASENAIALASPASEARRARTCMRDVMRVPYRASAMLRFTAAIRDRSLNRGSGKTIGGRRQRRR